MRYSFPSMKRSAQCMVALVLGVVVVVPGQLAAQSSLPEGSASRVSSADGRAGQAPPPEVVAALGSPVLQGQKKYRWLAFTVYDIRLWVPAPVSPQGLFKEPLALELEYARSLYGKAIAERSLEEMQGLASIDETQKVAWLGFMEKAFPDVSKGDRRTGLWKPDGTVTFLLNGKETASVRDARFGKLFFGIWLAPGTSEPAMRSALLGLNP